jgi:serine/threonine-protein kinase
MSSPPADASRPVVSESGRTWTVPEYTELRLLGGGGFGEVVLATHDATGNQVAIKYLRRDLLADPELAALFRAEAATLEQLDSPYVVRFYEYVEGPSGAAIVMELVDGVTLAEILKDQGKTTALGALVVLYGSLLGLAAAHGRGVVHRDYKPGNVLVNGAGASKLTDFGIAALAGDRPMPTGTARYMPPEQFEGAEATPAADVYAATVTFYQCLTGRPPFSGQTTMELYEQHKAASVPMEPVPAPLRSIVARGMAKNPAERPANAASLASELRTAAEGAFGPDWEDRGRSNLAEAALLLALLWPSSGTSGVAGTSVEQLHGSEPGHAARPPQSHPGGQPHPGGGAHPGGQAHAAPQAQPGAHPQPVSEATRQRLHEEHVRHEEHLQHVRHEEHLEHLKHVEHLEHGEHVTQARPEEAGHSGRPARSARRLRPRSRLHLAVAAGGAVVVVAAVAGVAAALTGGSAAASTMTGTWKDQYGNIMQFTSTGPDSWTGQVTKKGPDFICLPIDTQLTGSDGHYRGTTAFYTVSGNTCGAREADGTTTVTLDAGGDKASVVILTPTGGSYNSGTWTRE